MSTIYVRMQRDHTYTVDEKAGITRRIPREWVGNLDEKIARKAIDAGDAEDLTPRVEEDKPSGRKSVAEVLAMADADGVAFPTFKAEAAKWLGDKTPDKKADIVAELKKLQPAA